MTLFDSIQDKILSQYGIETIIVYEGEKVIIAHNSFELIGSEIEDKIYDIIEDSSIADNILFLCMPLYFREQRRMR